MINEKTHNKLITAWKKYGKVYQVRNKRVKQRFEWFDTVAPMLSGLDVLEIGTNAGLTMIEADMYVNTYWGLEPKQEYYKQAIKTIEFMKLKKCLVSPETFKEWFRTSPMKNGINGLILSRVLYWLSDHEVCQIQSMLNNVKVVIVVNGKQPKNKNSFGFHLDENCKDFFVKAGFKWVKSLDHKRLYCGVAWK